MAEIIHPVTRSISIPERELEEKFIQSGGPGGQNVNKVATSVQLRFDAAHSPSLPARVKAQLKVVAGSRMTAAGVIVIVASRHRTQERNRADARERLFDLIREAAKPPPPVRRATRPTLGSKKRRLESKAKRGAVKKMRGSVRGDD